MLENAIYLVKLLFFVFLGVILLRMIIEVVFIVPREKRKRKEQLKAITEELNKIFNETKEEILKEELEKTTKKTKTNKNTKTNKKEEK